MRALDVAVVGELNLDLILYGLPHQLEPNREFLAESLAVTLGSSSAIFAHNLSVLGTKVGFVSRIGADPLGEIALRYLATSGVDVSQVRKVPGRTSTGLTVILSHADGRNILTYAGTMNELCFEDLNLDYLASARHFHLSSFFLHRALRPRIAELLQLMKHRGLSTSLDTNDDAEDRWDGHLHDTLPYVDVFLPNEREAKKIAGVDSLETAVSKLRRMVPVLVVKLGAAGAIAYGPEGCFQCAAPVVEVIDTVGAGDSFDAGFIHAYLRGAATRECLGEANATGAFSTTRSGGTEAFRDRAYCAQFLHRYGANAKRDN